MDCTRSPFSGGFRCCALCTGPVNPDVIRLKEHMKSFEQTGNELRADAKSLVLDFMRATEACSPAGSGMRQAEIFRRCGFSWAEFPRATTSNQQYWVVALLWELESNGDVEQIRERGPWRLTDTGLT